VREPGPRDGDDVGDPRPGDTDDVRDPDPRLAGPTARPPVAAAVVAAVLRGCALVVALVALFRASLDLVDALAEALLRVRLLHAELAAEDGRVVGAGHLLAGVADELPAPV